MHRRHVIPARGGYPFGNQYLDVMIDATVLQHQGEAHSTALFRGSTYFSVTSGLLLSTGFVSDTPTDRDVASLSAKRSHWRALNVHVDVLPAIFRRSKAPCAYRKTAT